MADKTEVHCPAGYRIVEAVMTPAEFTNELCVLSQMRRKFIGINGLAENILKNTLEHPVLVIELDAVQARKYVRVVHRAYGGQKSIRGLKKTSEGKYRIVVAGERRTRAIRLLDGQTEGGFPVRVFVPDHDADFMHMLHRQVAENIGNKITPEEDSRAIAALWNITKSDDVTYASFAKLIDRPASFVSESVKLYEAPDYLHEWTNENPNLFRQGMQLAKLAHAGVGEDIIRRMMCETKARRTSVRELARSVSSVVRHHLEQKSEDTTFGLFAELPLVQQVRELFLSKLGKDANTWASAISHELMVTLTLLGSELPEDLKLLLKDRRTSLILANLFEAARKVNEAMPRDSLPELVRKRQGRELEEAVKKLQAS